jgi:hypothetical protein
MQCRKCKKPAKSACRGCRESPILDGDAPIAHYCSSACRKAHRSHHKAICLRLKDRTTLYRVAKMAQRLYYIYRELTWAQLKVDGVEKVGDDFVLRGTVRAPSAPRPFGLAMQCNAMQCRSSLRLPALCSVFNRC